MKILNFDDFVNEGFMSKTYDRIKKGEERTEDKIVHNVGQWKEIDLGFPFVIAGECLVVNREGLFEYEELLKYMKVINKTGWRLPTKEDIQKSFVDKGGKLNKELYVNHSLLKSGGGKASVEIGRKGYEDKLVLACDYYWLYDDLFDDNADILVVNDCRLYRDRCISVNIDSTDTPNLVLLIKDKDNV